MTDLGDRSDREIDLDIVSASWRSLTHNDGYEQLIEAWDRKLHKTADRDQTRLIDRVLSRQLGAIESLLAREVDLKVSDPLEEALQASSAPTMILSPAGIVVALSQDASAFFGLKVGEAAGDDWLRPDSVKNFEAILRSAERQGNANYAIIRALHPDGEESLAEVYPLAVEPHSKYYIVVRSLELEWLPEVNTKLAQAFDLSEAEAEVCRLLFQLRDIQRIADQRGVTLETTRTQIKQIFAKMEVHSKVELMRVLGLVCARTAKQNERRSLKYLDPLQNERIITRSDGRRLAYSWTGAKEGTEVLYVHGSIPYFLLHEPLRGALIENNIKLIYISIPGHGNSEIDAEISQLEDGASAVIELCDHLGLRGIAGLASYGGGLWLTRAASLRPDLFAAQLIIGVNWNLHAERLRRLPLHQRTLANIARTAPKVFDLICRIGFRRMIEEGPDFFLNRSFGGMAMDRASIRDPELQSLLRPACQHLVNQGPSAFVKMQCMIAQHRIQDWMGRLAIPVHFLVPVDVERGSEADLREIRKLGPLVSYEEVLNAGELLPFQAPQLFIARLQELVARCRGACG